MYYLNAFLKQKSGKDQFPEQQPNCGKFKALYKMLHKYYAAWKVTEEQLLQQQQSHLQQEPRKTMLRIPVDDLLIKYVDDFTNYYNKFRSAGRQADGLNQFQILSDLIPQGEVSQ